ncbi:hypothetical protein BC830DRAFT_1159841 [Chytriomyces sp. MP71]|nr:hypothetical protein BC830DRAFT_1159841 [Chytriomyces sp. MP71]
MEAEVKGMGPTYRICLSLLNTGSTIIEDSYVMLSADSRLHRIEWSAFEIPVIVPSQKIERFTFMRCSKDSGMTKLDGMVQVIVFEGSTRNVLISLQLVIPTFTY